MRVVVGNLKGGAGKTTTAVHLALGLARAGRTLLVDADPQQSALDWSEQAAEGGDFPPVVVSWPSRDLPRRLAQVAGDYQHVVIDTGPGHETILRSALMAGDLFLITLAPTLIEVTRLEPTFALAAEVEVTNPFRVRLLLTRVRYGTRSSREARTFLAQHDIPTLKAEVSMRERYALSYGTNPEDLGEYDDVLGELEEAYD